MASPIITIPGKRKAVLASENTFHFSWRNIHESAKRLFMREGCSWFVAHTESMKGRFIASAGCSPRARNHVA